jgi:hypothetical protein
MGTSREDDRPPERRQHQSPAEPDEVSAGLPRLWSELPLEKRRQLAQHVAHLLQRQRSGLPRLKEKHCADHDVGD